MYLTYGYLRMLQSVPFQPELQAHAFGLVQFPLTHDGEQMAIMIVQMYLYHR